MHAEAHERDKRMQIYLNQRRSLPPSYVRGIMDSGEREEGEANKDGAPH